MKRIKQAMKYFALWILILLGLAFASCNHPQLKNYAERQCFYLADCVDRFPKESKVVCATFADMCKDADKESRIKDRIEYCFNNFQAKGFTSQGECRLYLNQK